MKTLITLLLLLSLATLAQTRIIPFSIDPTIAPPAGQTPVATLDFEENDLTDWTVVGSGTIVSDTGNTGSYSMGVYGAGGTATISRITFTALDSVYVIFYLMLPVEDYSSDSYTYNAYFRASGGSGTELTLMGEEIGGIVTLEPSYFVVGATSASMYVDTTAITTAAWHKIKLFYSTNGVDASEHGMWIDDIPFQNTPAAAFTNGRLTAGGTSSATITSFEFCIQGTYPTASALVRVDDINIYDAADGDPDQ